MEASATVVPVCGLAGVTLHLTRPADTAARDLQQPRGGLHLYLALDCSGSMFYEDRLVHAKRAITEFLDDVSLGAFASCSLVVYCDEVTLCQDLITLDKKGRDALLATIDADGGTPFYAVLETLNTLIASLPPTDRHVICFFTDGCECDNRPLFAQPRSGKAYLKAMQQELRVKEALWQVHCLGFGGDHDAAFLSTLALAGTEPGGFRYVQVPDQDIGPALESVMETIQEHLGGGMRRRLGGTLHAGSQQQHVMLQLAEPAAAAGISDEDMEEGALAAAATEAEPPPPAGPQLFKGFAAFDCSPEQLLLPLDGGAAEVAEENGDRKKAFLKLGGPKGEEVPVELASRSEMPMQELVQLVPMVVKNYVIRSTQRLSNDRPAREGLMAIREVVHQMRAGLVELQGRLKELLPLGRVTHRSARTNLTEAAQLVNCFEAQVLSSALTGTLTNHSIAQLNDLAYRSITNRGLHTRLEKRVGGNVDLREQVDAAVEAVLQGVDVTGLPEDPNYYGTCAISCCNYKEALQSGDCLCLGLDVARPQAAIMDASRLKVLAIHPTRITADSFMEAVLYALGSSERWAEEVHGGFKGQSDEQGVVVGEGREPITGAMPLFINPTHWAVARQLAKPLFGWMCTLNPLGYTDEQMRTLPFLVLSRALQDLASGPGEFKCWVADQVLQTCMAVYRWRRRTILASLTGADDNANTANVTNNNTGSGAVEQSQPDAAADGDAAGATVGLAAGSKGGEAAVTSANNDGGAPAAAGCLWYLVGGPAARTLDVVASGEVMLMQLLCALRAGDIVLDKGEWEALRVALLEEELRRCQALAFWKEDLTTPAAAATLLRCRPDAEADALIAAWMDEGEDEQAGGADDRPVLGSTESLEELKGRAHKAAAAIDWEAVLAQNDGGHQPVVQLRVAYADRVVPLLRLAGLVEKVADPSVPVADAAQGAWAPPAKLSEWLSPTQEVAMALQNARGVRNADRRKWIEDGLWLDPLAAAQEILCSEWAGLVLSKIKTALSDVRTGAYRAAAARRAARFAAATTLAAAADALAGWRLGQHFELPAAFAALLQPPGGGVAGAAAAGGGDDEGSAAPLALEKMRLLMSWDDAEGRRLRLDKAKPGVQQAPGVSGWAPSRWYVHRFLAANRSTVDVEKAIALFVPVCNQKVKKPVTEAYLRKQYAAGFPDNTPRPPGGPAVAG